MKSMIVVLATVLSLHCMNAAAEVVVPDGYEVSLYVGWVEYGDPKSIDCDSEGYLYVANDGDGAARCIHRVAPGGETVENWGPYVQDPDCVGVDSAGNCYIGSSNGGLYKIFTNGTSSLVTTVNMGNNHAMCVDKLGVLGETNAVYAGNARDGIDIAQVTSNGVSSVFVSSGLLNVFSDMETDDVGYLYATEYDNTPFGVRRISPDGTVVNLAEFTLPYSIAFHEGTHVFYVGDTQEDCIYRMDLNGNKTLFASGIEPRGMAFGPDGNLYVMDTSGSARIMCISRNPVDTFFAGDEQLMWNCTSGFVYDVEFRTNLLAGGWGEFTPQITATNTAMTAAVEFTNSPSGFFRVIPSSSGFF